MTWGEHRSWGKGCSSRRVTTALSFCPRYPQVVVLKEFTEKLNRAIEDHSRREPGSLSLQIPARGIALLFVSPEALVRPPGTAGASQHQHKLPRVLPRAAPPSPPPLLHLPELRTPNPGRSPGFYDSMISGLPGQGHGFEGA